MCSIITKIMISVLVYHLCNITENIKTLLLINKEKKISKTYLRKMGEKQREEKKKLEYYIADFLKAREVNKEKLGKVRDICDE